MESSTLAKKRRGSRCAEDQRDERMSALVGLEASRARLRSLQAQRSALEVEAEALADALNSPGVNGEAPAGIKTALVDREGFPRADIDIMNVKTQRNRLAVVNTDHKEVMKKIEAELAQMHSLSGNESVGEKEQQQQQQQQQASRGLAPAPTAIPGSGKAFAIVDEILPGSPAALAGLQDGDQLVGFGTIRFETIDNINCIPALIGANVNKPVPVEVKRRGADPAAAADTLHLTLLPRPWGGRGLLGCHLTPIR